MANLLTSAFFSFVEIFAALICILSIFRLPIRYNILRITLIAAVYSLIATYTFEQLPDFAILLNLSCLIIMFTIFYQLPFFYSILIVVIYFLTGGIFEYAAFLFVSNVLKFPENTLVPGGLGSRIVYLLTAGILFILAWFLQRRKIGFMFITNRFTVRQAVKGYNFALSAVLIVSIVMIQLTSIMFNHFSIHAVILIVLTLIFLIGIYVAYKQNKKQINEKYERLKNR